MIYQNNNFENQEIKNQCGFGDVLRKLQISKLLKQANIRSKSGKSFFDVFQFLRARNISSRNKRRGQTHCAVSQ